MSHALPIVPLETSKRRVLRFVQQLPRQANIAFLPGRLDGFHVGDVKQLLARCNGAEAFDERLKPERIASWEAVEGAGGRHPSDAVEDPWQAHAAIRELLALGSSETNPLKVAERRRRAS
jgi:hypothetical protein